MRDIDGGSRTGAVVGRRLARVVAVAVVALAGGATTAHAQGLAFEPFATAPVGADPTRLVTADFDGDGLPDLASADRGDRQVTVLRSTGTGLERWATPALTGAPGWLTTGDVDGDGRPDIITSDRGPDGVTVLRNTGTGFVTWATVALDAAPGPVTVGDLDRDGRLDVVVTSQAANRVTVLRNTGDGREFAPWASVATALPPFGVTVADFDGDGRPDLAATGSTLATRTVSVLRNTGDGRDFAPWAAPGVYNGPRDLLARDFDGDGRMDIAVGASQQYGVNLLRNTGGGFDTSYVLTTWAGSGGVHSIDAADVDLDGRPDLVTGDFHRNVATVVLNTGGGVFSGYGIAQAWAVGEAPIGTVAADLDGDGRPDIATVDRLSRRVTVLRNALPPAEVTLDRETVEFDPQVVGSASPTATVTLRNTGDGPFPVHAVRLTGPGTTDFARRGGTCVAGAIVPAGGTCTLELAFAPRSPGAKQDELAIAASPTATPLRVVLQGEGLQAPEGVVVPGPPTPTGPGTAVPPVTAPPTDATPGTSAPVPGPEAPSPAGPVPSPQDVPTLPETAVPSAPGAPQAPAAPSRPAPLRLSLGGSKTPTMTRAGAVRVQLRCPAGAAPSCRVTLRLTARLRGRTVVVGRRTVTVRGSRATVAPVTLTAAARRVVRRAGRLRATATVSGTSGTERLAGSRTLVVRR